MKHIFLTAAVAFATLQSTPAKAQFPYNLSVQTGQTYAPLSGAVSLTNNTLWTADDHFAAPIGFNCNLGGTVNDTLYLAAGNFATPQLAAVMSGFSVMGTGLMDRGNTTTIPSSDIRYLTTGTQGNRIFKLEVSNAGFEAEFSNSGELKDSVSFQIWLYESNNAVEFRYGPSTVSNFQDYFGTHMFAGFIKNIDTAQGTFDKFFVLNGSTTAPTIDSLNSIMDAKGFTSVPDSGVVYKFTPKGASTGIRQVTPGTVAAVYPTVCSQFITVKPAGKQAVYATVTNNTGQCVIKTRVHGGPATVDLSGMAPGSYFVRLSDDAGAYEVHHIVKN